PGYDDTALHGFASRSRWRNALLLVRGDVVDGVADGLDVLGLLVGDLDLELLLHRHHQLDDVEAVGAEILDERGLELDLVLADAELLRDDGPNLRLNLGLCHETPASAVGLCPMRA